MGVVLALVEKMHEVMEEDVLVTMELVCPLSTDDHAEIPSYQTYACLAWLRSIGVVKQHGRRGYTVAPREESIRQVEAAWVEMPILRS